MLPPYPPRDLIPLDKPLARLLPAGDQSTEEAPFLPDLPKPAPAFLTPYSPDSIFRINSSPFSLLTLSIIWFLRISSVDPLVRFTDLRFIPGEALSMFI